MIEKPAFLNECMSLPNDDFSHTHTHRAQKLQWWQIAAVAKKEYRHVRQQKKFFRLIALNSFKTFPQKNVAFCLYPLPRPLFLSSPQFLLFFIHSPRSFIAASLFLSLSLTLSSSIFLFLLRSILFVHSDFLVNIYTVYTHWAKCIRVGLECVQWPQHRIMNQRKYYFRSASNIVSFDILLSYILLVYECNEIPYSTFVIVCVCFRRTSSIKASGKQMYR